MLNQTIQTVANGWNAAREVLPQLPYIAVYRDDANAGRCFVNQTPGYSVASACVIPKNIEGVKGLAARNPDAQGHLIGAAMAVSDGLTADEAFTAVCHTMGHIMGLENSTDPESCMSHESGTEKKWYTDADAAAILRVYEHSDTVGSWPKHSLGQVRAHSGSPAAAQLMTLRARALRASSQGRPRPPSGRTGSPPEG